MPKPKRKLTAIDGMPVDEFLAKNADPIWLHENGMWEMIHDDSDRS